MHNFVYGISTKAYFGKGQISQLGNILLQYGKKVLFVYGGGSIKSNGIYDDVLNCCKENGIEIVEFGGVEPNPTLKTLKKGIALAKAEAVDCILAAGGGSAIDCAKGIGVGVKYDGDVWDFYIGKAEIQDSLPTVGIITIAASGSELSKYSVITNEETLEKNGARSDIMRLRDVIIDPAYTFTVNALYTAAGVVDAISHVLEGYFSAEDAYMQNRMCEAVLKTCVTYGRRVIDFPEDYEARAQILWASGWALNGFLAYGKAPCANAAHNLEHILSAKYNIVHGVGLAIVTIPWLKFARERQDQKRFIEFGKNVWGLSGTDREVAEKSIACLEGFFKSLDIPMRLRDLGIPKEDLPMIANHVFVHKQPELWYCPVTENDILSIYQNAY